MMTAADVRDKRRWSLAKTLFEATSLGGVWHLLTEEQREHWYHAAELKDEFVTHTMKLWQVTIMLDEKRSATLYLDAGVQGLSTKEAAIDYVSDRLYPMLADPVAGIMAIHYDVVLPRPDVPMLDQI